MTNALDARHAAVLAKVYGHSFQNPNIDQATYWQTTYENLAEGLYSSQFYPSEVKNSRTRDRTAAPAGALQEGD